MAWEPFPLIEIERFDRLDHCVTRMNEINRRLIREYSAVRAICQPAQ